MSETDSDISGLGWMVAVKREKILKCDDLWQENNEIIYMHV